MHRDHHHQIGLAGVSDTQLWTDGSTAVSGNRVLGFDGVGFIGVFVQDLHGYPAGVLADRGDFVIEAHAIGAVWMNLPGVVQHDGFQAQLREVAGPAWTGRNVDRKSTRLNSSHVAISYAVFCLKKKTRT